MDPLAIVMRKLTKVYRGHVGRGPVCSVDRLDLEIGAGEVFGFLGQNGAGKTTTIKMLCGLLKPTSGEAAIFGESVRHHRTRRFIGYLPENPYFYEYLTPPETLDFYGRLHGLSVPERERTWNTLSELLELGPIAGMRVRHFSKGMRQRLGFAVAMVGDPPVLILDEPMSGLDPMGRHHIRQVILGQRERGKTVFFSSHVLSDVEQICDRVGVLSSGRLIAQGRIDALVSRHVSGIEIVASGLSAEAGDRLASMALRARISEAGRHFEVDTPEASDSLIAAILHEGGRLVEVTPFRDSLEDYFVRIQTDTARGEVSA